jgi:hypothetical protein
MAERPRRLNRARRAPPHAPNSATACRSACPRPRATAIKAPRRRDAARARPQSVAISPSRPAAASAPALAATSVRSLSHSLPRATPACHAYVPRLRTTPTYHAYVPRLPARPACHARAPRGRATPACRARAPHFCAKHTRHICVPHPTHPNPRGTSVRHTCVPDPRAHTCASQNRRGAPARPHPRAHTHAALTRATSRTPKPTRHTRAPHLCAPHPARPHPARLYLRIHASQARLTTDASAPRARVSGLGGDL